MVTKKKIRKKYSVLLLRPDTVADIYGQDTYYAHVKALSVHSAIAAARRQVMKVDNYSEYKGYPTDYFVLLVTAGHSGDIQWC